jgi:hypothetical protein
LVKKDALSFREAFKSGRERKDQEQRKSYSKLDVTLLHGGLNVIYA